MIFKAVVIVSTILSFWFPVARCESDGLSELEKQISATSLPEIGIIKPANANKDWLNVGKSVLKKMDTPAKNYQKYRDEDQRSLRFLDNTRSNINVNLNHRDFPSIQWTKLSQYPSDTWHQQPDVNEHEYHKPKDDRVFDMIPMRPNPKNGYHVLHSQAGMHRNKHRHRSQEISSKDNSDDLMSAEEENENSCSAAIQKALDYLQRIEINIRKVGRDLKSLMV